MQTDIKRIVMDINSAALINSKSGGGGGWGGEHKGIKARLKDWHRESCGDEG